ncbi:MAG: hypothetical protein AAF492_11375, partial [Verrucomicrobiota bacterium]
MIKSILFIAIVSSQLSTSYAEAPERINYQGRMIDDGQLVNGSTQLIFRIYDDPTAGNLHYAETQTVTIIDGLYATQIGLSNPAPGALSAALSNAMVYLELEVGGTTLSPRERIVSVAYALKAGGVSPGAIDSAMLADGSVSAVDLAADAVGSEAIADGSITAADIDAGSFSNTFWRVNGNAGVTPGANFLGTTDNQPFEVHV